jgi:hypothetical protein
MRVTGEIPLLEAAGLLFGGRGAHTSRTMMLAELGGALKAVPSDGARREDFTRAIREENALGKVTASNRRLTNQRLGELYGLDAGIPVFRALRRAWRADEEGRPRIALLCALARDPLLRATADLVLGLKPGAELVRVELLAALRQHVEARLNDASLDKVARNAASSWAQSGHLQGRTRKHRVLVDPSPGAVAYAVWLGSLQGLEGVNLLTSGWCRVFDGSRQRLLDMALRAKQLGLVRGSVGGDVVHLDPTPLLMAKGG